ncbi:lysozyme inhibitor LprI family protein [Acidithiobacillus sp.]
MNGLLKSTSMLLGVLTLAVSAAASAQADPYANGQMAKLAQYIWEHPNDKKAIQRFFVGQWKYVASVGFPKRDKNEPESQKDKFWEGLIDTPNYFLGRTVNFYPNAVDRPGLFPGMESTARCGPPRYVAEKEVWEEYVVPPRRFIQTSLATLYYTAINEIPELAPELKPFEEDENLWILLSMETTCVRAPGKKPEKITWTAELSKGGYLAKYFMAGDLILKKISNEPAPPSGPSACSQARTPIEYALCANPDLKKLDETMAAAYHQAFVATVANSPARKALIDSQRQWLKARDACQADASCLEGAYRERVQVLKSS